MKKILYSTVVLFLFSLSVLLFQYSCAEDVEAQKVTTETQGRFFYSMGDEYFTANFDGSNIEEFEFELPEGYDKMDVVLSQNQKTLIVSAIKEPGYHFYVFSVSIDDGSVEMIMNGDDIKPGYEFFIHQTF